MKQTALYQAHLQANAKIVDFAGWQMPIHYGSQIQEHHQIRKDAGLFDVSHMVILDLTGSQCRDYLKHLLANNIDKLQQSGKALYSCMLNEKGGVIDDLIVYYLQEDWFRLVVNAGTREKDIAWMQQQCLPFEVELKERDDLSMLAVQGPQARQKVIRLLNKTEAEKAEALKVFYGALIDDYFIARTGYTGEDGFEIIVSNKQALSLWYALLEVGIQPCGLGARDTLRLEAGMNLYGQDMDEEHSPLISGLAWTIAWDENRDFIGRKALERQKQQGISDKLVGLVLNGKGVLRNHQRVITSAGEGEITSGSFSPTLGKAIALARIPLCDDKQCQVKIRKKTLAVMIVKPPFARKGKSCL